MAFHIHPKWLFYRFAHPPSFEIGFRGISGKLFIIMALGHNSGMHYQVRKIQTIKQI